jgi:hypothetical protein
MPALDRWINRIIALLEKLQATKSHERIQKTALYVSLPLFLTGLIVSIRYLPQDLVLSRPRFLVYIATIGVAARLLLSTLETRLSAKVVGAHFGWLRSVQIGLVSSAANLLPLPGGPLVRIAALKHAGATLSLGGAVTALLGAMWVGLAFLCAASCIVDDYSLLALGFFAVGLLGLVSASLGLKRICNSWRLVLLSLMMKSAMIFIMLLRLAWAFAALDVNVTPSEITVFSVSGVAGSLVSVVPAGLGVSEVVAAALAPLTDIAPAVAYLAVTLNRVVSIPVLLAATFVAALLRGDRKVGDPA